MPEGVDIIGDSNVIGDLFAGSTKTPDTLLTLFAPSGASTLQWRAAQDLHILAIYSSSGNGTLYVGAMTTITQPGVFVGMRQVQPKSGNQWIYGLNIAVTAGETVFWNDTVASVVQVLFAYDVKSSDSLGE